MRRPPGPTRVSSRSTARPRRSVCAPAVSGRSGSASARRRRRLAGASSTVAARSRPASTSRSAGCDFIVAAAAAALRRSVGRPTPAASKPPSTARNWPLMKLASSLHRKPTVLRHLLGRAVAAQRDRVLVVGADRHAVHELGHLGLDRPRADRVDADADVAELHRELLGQVQQRGLAGAVGHAQRARAQARDRRDVDDRAAAGLEHLGHAGLRAQERAVEVGVEHVAELGVAGLHHRLEDGDAGVVDELVDAAELRDDLRDARARPARGCDTSACTASTASGRSNAATVRSSVCWSMSSSATRWPRSQEPLADGQADAARASGDDGDGRVGGDGGGRAQGCLLDG